MGNNTEVIQGLLDKLGVAQAQTEQLRAALAAIQARLASERALADELAETLRQCSNALSIQDGQSGTDTASQRGQAEAVLARWVETRGSP